MTQGRTEPTVGRGLFQVAPHLGAVQKGTSPKTPPALQGSSDSQRGSPGVAQRETLAKMPISCQCSICMWQMPEAPACACTFPTERQLRTTVAGAVARQSRKTPHFKCELQVTADVVTSLCDFAVKSFGQSGCQPRADQHRAWTNSEPRRGLGGNGGSGGTR